jgi:FtsH-binding integral membrane protein
MASYANNPYGQPQYPSYPVGGQPQYPVGGQPHYPVGGQPQYAPQQPMYAVPVQAYPPQSYAPHPQQYVQPTYQMNNNQYPQHQGLAKPAQPQIMVLAQDVGSNSIDTSKYVHQAEQSVRVGFIRKVYAILSLQLFLTFGMVAVFTFVPSVKNFVAKNPGILWAAILLSFVFLIALSCFPSVSRKHPTNLICLALFTLCEGYLVGAISSYSGADAVIKAVACTLIITTGLTIYAWQTKVDFTAMGGYMFAASCSLLLVGLMCAIFQSQIMMNIYAGLGCLIFSAYIVYDTQLIIGGAHHSHSFEIDEYVFAALNLYIDIVQLFLFLLRLFRNND